MGRIEMSELELKITDHYEIAYVDHSQPLII